MLAAEALKLTCSEIDLRSFKSHFVKSDHRRAIKMIRFHLVCWLEPAFDLVRNCVGRNIENVSASLHRNIPGVSWQVFLCRSGSSLRTAANCCWKCKKHRMAEGGIWTGQHWIIQCLRGKSYWIPPIHSDRNPDTQSCAPACNTLGLSPCAATDPIFPGHRSAPVLDHQECSTECRQIVSACFELRHTDCGALNWIECRVYGKTDKRDKTNFEFCP